MNPATARRERSLAILHVITRLEPGGSSDCTLLQAIGAARRGHRVTVAAGPSAAHSPWLGIARRTPRLDVLELPALRRAPHPIHDLRALLALVAILRSRPFDVVHTHTSKAGALGRVAALLTGRRHRLVHQPHGHLFYGYYGPLGHRLVVLVERLLAPLSRALIVLTQRGAEEHLARRVGRPDLFRVVRSGIDFRPFRRARLGRGPARHALGIPPDALVVGFLGRLEHVKGVDLLLEGYVIAARSRPRLRLHLAGDGPLRAPLLDRARSAGVADRVTCGPGWVDPAVVLPAFDLFVLPSRNEGMGRSLVEAMACGLPVVAAAVGGIPEVLEEGRSGLLVPPGDPEGIALALGRLADDPDLRSALGRRARARALAFGAGRMNRSLLRLYREVAA